MRAGLASLVLLALAAPAFAQIGPKPPTKPVKPTVIVPAPVKPSISQPSVAVKPRVGGKLTSAQAAELGQLRKELKDTETEIASLEDAKRARERLKSAKDAIDQAGDADVMRLQQAMEKKAQLESMISKVERGAEEGGQTTVSGLKAS